MTNKTRALSIASRLRLALAALGGSLSGATLAQVSLEAPVPVPPAILSSKGGALLELPEAALAAAARRAAPAPAAAPASRPTPNPTPNPSPTPTPTPTLPAHVHEWLKQVNDIRAKGAQCGTQWQEPAQAVAWNAKLERTALLHTQEQATLDNYGHRGANGSDPGQRALLQGYYWSLVGENVAAGQANMQAAIEGWLKSPGHCRNMLSSAFKEIGIAQAPGRGRYATYFTMVLGLSGGGTTPEISEQEAQLSEHQAALAVVNRVRSQGGSCGATAMPPVAPLKWDERVVQVAQWEALERVHKPAPDDPKAMHPRLNKVGMRALNVHYGNIYIRQGPAMAAALLLGIEGLCKSLLDAKATHMALAATVYGTEEERARFSAEARKSQHFTLVVVWQ